MIEIHKLVHTVNQLRNIKENSFPPPDFVWHLNDISLKVLVVFFFTWDEYMYWGEKLYLWCKVNNLSYWATQEAPFRQT
jgi:hypothetical protein